jgi:hypothetical protein
MTFLLNGCSFSANYKQAGTLASQLGYDHFINLSRPGSCNRRIIRSTMEYLLGNQAKFVMLGLTFWDRQEGSFLPNRTDKDTWVSFSPNGLSDPFIPKDSDLLFNNSRSSIEKYVLDRYRYDLNLRYIDQLLCDLLMFTAYLDQNQIRYIIFNTCELEYATYYEQVNRRYQVAIRSNPRIISLTKFIMNMYLHECGAKQSIEETHLDPNCIHYDEREYRHVNEYMLNYILKNNL